MHFASVLDSIRGHIDTTLGNAVPVLDLGLSLDASTEMAVAILFVELTVMGMDPALILYLADILGLEPQAPPPVIDHSALAALNPIRYRGYYWDAETGYYWLQTRYYDPQWRRFLNADSTFIAGEDQLNGSNMYAYCNGNPVMYVDPTGRAVDIGSILNGFLNLLLIGLTWLAKAFSAFFTSGAFLQAWEGFLKIGKSIDIFKENPDNPWPGIGMIFSGLGDWFAGFFTWVGNFFNDLFGWKPGGSTGGKGELDFYSDAEMAVPSSSSGSSGNSGLSQAPGIGSTMPGIKVKQVNLYHNYIFPDDYFNGMVMLDIVLQYTTTLAADAAKYDCDDVVWELRGTDQDKKKITYTEKPNGEKNKFKISKPSGECSLTLTATLKKNGSDIGVSRTIPIVVITKNRPFSGVAKVNGTRGYITPSTSNTTDSKLLDITSKQPYIANLEIFGTIGNFYYAIVREKVNSSVTTHFRFVEKDKVSAVVWPVHDKNDYSNSWGWRRRPSNDPYKSKEVQLHKGVDVGAGSVDHEIVAIADGIVKFSGSTTGARGYVVVLEHNVAGLGTFYSLYEHLKSTGLATKNSSVKAGKKVGDMGSTGSGNPDWHLHFEIMRKAPPGLSSNTIGSTKDYTINPIEVYLKTRDEELKSTTNTTYDNGKDRVRDLRQINNANNSNTTNFNPQPFFVKYGSYSFSPIFNWNEINDPLPAKYSHSRDYSWYKPGEHYDTNS